MEKDIKKVYKNVFEIKVEDLNSNAIIQGKINKLDCFTNMQVCIYVQCNLNLVTLLVSAKTVTKSHNVTKSNDFMKQVEKWSLKNSH